MLVNLANACDETGRGDESIGYLRRAIGVDSNCIPAYGNLGFKYQELGDFRTAIGFYDKVISLNPTEPLGYSNRSYNRFMSGDIAGAKADIDHSIRLYPGNSYAFRTRALIGISEKRFDAACYDLK